MEKIDGVLFVFAGLSTVWLAYLLIKEGVRPGWPVLLLIAFWVLVTYILLPRVHRILTRLYVPGYFIGRTRTSDGLLGDPVNLALLGDEAQIHQAMEQVGWIKADDVSVRSGAGHRLVHPAPAQLSRSPGQSVAALRSSTGFRLSAGGRRQPVKTSPCEVLALP